jgi:hypothetical protein
MIFRTLKVYSATSLLCLLMAISVSAQARKSDTQHDGLAAQVRSVRSEIAKFSCKSGNCVEGSRSLASIIDYGPDGYLTHAIVPGIQPYHSFVYTANGDRLERQSSIRITKPITTSDFGFPSEPYTNTTFYRWTFKHDRLGNRIEEARYKRTSQALAGSTIMAVVLIGRLGYKYGEDGRKTEMSYYNSDGSLKRKVVYEYGDQGSITIEAEVSGNGKSVSKRYYSYEYDGKGNWIKRTTSMWLNEKGASFYLPVEVEYRDITYY